MAQILDDRIDEEGGRWSMRWSRRRTSSVPSTPPAGSCTGSTIDHPVESRQIHPQIPPTRHDSIPSARAFLGSLTGWAASQVHVTTLAEGIPRSTSRIRRRPHLHEPSAPRFSTMHAQGRMQSLVWPQFPRLNCGGAWPSPPPKWCADAVALCIWCRDGSLSLSLSAPLTRIACAASDGWSFLVYGGSLRSPCYSFQRP
jgi:hypothetical protein